MNVRVLAVGLGKTGEALARWAARTGAATIVVDDHPDRDDFEARAQTVHDLGVEVVGAPDVTSLTRLVERADLVVPNPAVPEHHPVFAIARRAGVPVISEIELAWRELDGAGRRVIAITGTNGKTTVTTLVTAMLNAAGMRAIVAGNIGHPLLDAATDDVDVVVAEVSSFQLAYVERFRPHIAVLLNLAEDHLDWHASFDRYVDAKARIVENQRASDVLVFNGDDPVVRGVAARAPGRTVAFTLTGDVGYRVASDRLVDAAGTTIIATGDLPRRLPIDLANNLAAAAAAGAAGVPTDAMAAALRSFAGLPHRVTLVGQSGGVQFYDDSKATNPHATLHALAAFPSVVLIAGGRNKNNDLTVLREAGNIRAVVAVGEAADEVDKAFTGTRPVTRAGTMHDAVRAAAAAAQPGDAVLLSPACSSWDWYRNYAERGDDFAREVTLLIAEHGDRGDRG
jgi:UDP-N-acetylmuramoylalanine--D-glutamate ligase